MKTKTLHFRPVSISRNKAQPDSAVAACAYISRQNLYDEKQQKTHYYQRRGGLVERGIFAPDDAAEWMEGDDQRRAWQRLGNVIEAKEDGHNRRAQAQLGKDFHIAAPRELTDAQNWELAKTFAQKFNERGLVAAVGFHVEEASDGGKNPHFHFFVPMREVAGTDFGKKYRALDGKKGGNNPELMALRRQYYQCVNDALADAGVTDVYYDPEKQEDKEPGVHLGKEATALQKKGEKTRKADHNRKVHVENLMRPYDRAAGESADPWAFPMPASEQQDWHRKFAEWHLIRGASMAARDATQKSQSSVMDAPATRALRNTEAAREQAKLSVRQTRTFQTRTFVEREQSRTRGSGPER